MNALAPDARAALDPVLVFERAFGFQCHDWQPAYLRETRPTALLKGRQVGASQAAGGLAIHEAKYAPGSLSAIISPSLKQSTEIATRVRAGLRRIGEPLAQDSASMLRLANGSRILSLPGTARSVRGYSANLLIIDEAAYVEHATWTAAKALVAATGGRLVVQSTPAAETGDFYDLWKDDDPSWVRFRIRSDEVPAVSAEFLANERRHMPPDAYAAEYECQFGRVGASLFTIETLAQLFPSP